MYCVRQITPDLYWVGGDDHKISLFENIHPVPRGVSYNSFLLLDKATALFDTVDWSIGRQFLENIEALLHGRSLDYLVIQHMEPDHAATLSMLLQRHPEITILAREKTFQLIKQFGLRSPEDCRIVKDGDHWTFGTHEFIFYSGAMVHWPEVMVSYDSTDGILFSADAFGTFGTLDGKLFNDERWFDDPWISEGRRYYGNIVGKYGTAVQALLQKIKGLDIRLICPLHGPLLRGTLDFYLEKYDLWSRYEPEEKGMLIVYGSMYGNTEAAAVLLANTIVGEGIHNVAVYDVSRTPVSQLIAETFRLSTLVLAAPTYNLGIFPPMHNFIMDMKALNIQNRTLALIENGSWASRSGSMMITSLQGMKKMRRLEGCVSLCSSLDTDTRRQIQNLAYDLVAFL